MFFFHPFMYGYLYQYGPFALPFTILGAWHQYTAYSMMWLMSIPIRAFQTFAMLLMWIPMLRIYAASMEWFWKGAGR